MRELTAHNKGLINDRTEHVLRMVAQRVRPEQAIPIRHALQKSIHESIERFWRVVYEQALEDVKQEFAYFEAMYRHALRLKDALAKERSSESFKEVRGTAQFVVNEVDKIQALNIIDHLGEGE